MRPMKRLLPLALALLLVLGLFAGCGQTTGTPEETSQGVQSQAPSDTGTREITDMAGRKVTIPAEIESVFSTSPVAAIYLYTLVPDKLLGWNYELNDIEKSIVLEKYHTLPNFGMGDAINYEAVIAAGPTIALNVGTINDSIADDSDKLSEKLGIPVVVVDGDLLSAPEAYRFMGELFGVEEQAEQLAAYAEDTFHDIQNMNISEEEKVRIYYGNGEDSLETAPAGSAHGQIIDLVNGVNVADLELGDGSRVQISLEQLLAWDPDVIVVNGEPKSNMSGSSAADAILNDPDFASLTAVKEGKVYGTPSAPFSWVDRPPGPNRIIGIRWLSGLIYPDALNFDVDEEVKEFFHLFYHVDLTDEQLEKLYDGTLSL
jgi:iron complex transport system substrate-binding protein